jgi:hypothetical protein
MIDRDSEVGALGGHVAVDAQLTRRATGGGACTQRGLYPGQFDQFRGVRHESRGNRVPSAPLRGLAAATAEPRQRARRQLVPEDISTVPFA